MHTGRASLSSRGPLVLGSSRGPDPGEGEEQAGDGDDDGSSGPVLQVGGLTGGPSARPPPSLHGQLWIQWGWRGGGLCTGAGGGCLTWIWWRAGALGPSSAGALGPWELGWDRVA